MKVFQAIHFLNPFFQVRIEPIPDDTSVVNADVCDTHCSDQGGSLYLNRNQVRKQLSIFPLKALLLPLEP